MESGRVTMYEEMESNVRQYETTKIVDGLGIGVGTISLADRVDNEEHPNQIDTELVSTTERIINSDKILTAIDVDKDGNPVEDDGCGDGRGVGKIFRGLKRLKRSLNRAKVFGGGLTMGVAAVIGSGKAAGRKLASVFTDTMQDFDEAGIAFGAHTDNHAEGANCGCGAIDKSPLIVANAVRFQDEITGAIKLLTGGSVDRTKLGTVFTNFTAYSEEIADDTSFSGRTVADAITKKHKVVKELEGPHLETHIVINTVEGHTVNQGLIRRETKGKAQVFAVDEWRIRQLAEKRYPNDPEASTEAYLSMLVYTLATAATLTKGDLPVYVVSRAPQLEAA